MNAGPDNDDERAGSRRVLGAALSFSTNFLAGILLFGFLGDYLDGKFGTAHDCKAIGIFLGLLYGGYELRRLVRQLEAADRQRHPPKP